MTKRSTWISRNLFDTSVQGGDMGAFDLNIDNIWKLGETKCYLTKYITILIY